MRAGVRVSFTDVAKRYERRVIFKGVSGEALPGEVLVITGPNGSGKSTLLRILSGLLRPTRGDVRYAAQGVELPRESWRGVLGMVAPAMATYEELSGLENLRFFATVRGVDGAEARSRRCLEAVGLDPDRPEPAASYSTGMLQRLKIAQAMLHEPPVLLLDEAGSNLDAAGRDWLGGFVRERAAAGATVVVATNDPREMEWGEPRVALSG